MYDNLYYVIKINTQIGKEKLKLFFDKFPFKIITFVQSIM